MGSMLPRLVWAQVTPGPVSPNPLVFLVPKRWYASLSLSSPSAVPSLHPLWAFLGALTVLLLLSMMLQGPRRALGQFLDLPALLRRVRRSVAILQRGSRVVGALFGFVVLSWTASQALTFRMEKGKDELAVLMKARGHLELGIEQGLHGMLTAFRDLGGLGDNFLLLVVAILVMSRIASDVRDPLFARGREGIRSGPPARMRATYFFFIWGCLILQAIGRVVARVSGLVELPLGGITVVEVVLIPLVVLVCDGFLLSWVLVELRNAVLVTRTDNEGVGTLGRVIDLTPAGMVACAAIVPARYIATCTLLLSIEYLPSSVVETWFGRYLRWQLGVGLADLQAIGLILIGLVGVAAWGRGTVRDIPNGWFRMLKAEGGHVALLLTATGITAGIATAIPYLILLLLPAQTWTLAAADSYSHYMTLPVALIATAALIDLGRDTLPLAHCAAPEVSKSETAATAEPVAS